MISSRQGIGTYSGVRLANRYRGEKNDLILKLKERKKRHINLRLFLHTKNDALIGISDGLLAEEEKILKRTGLMYQCGGKGVKPAQIDRLSLNKKRINDMAEGLRQIVSLRT